MYQWFGFWWLDDDDDDDDDGMPILSLSVDCKSQRA
jgi:hypothetical protein